MIEFKRIDKEDKIIMESLLSGQGERSFEYCFTNLWAWKDNYDTYYANVDGCFVTKEKYDKTYYLCPSGKNAKKAVLSLAQEAKEQDEQLAIISVSPKHKKELEEWFPGAFSFEETRDNEDYVYTVEKLAELEGKKLHGKRNHIHKFESLYPNWETELMTAENAAECLKIENLWISENEDSDEMDGTNAEYDAIKRCIENFDFLGLEGMLLKVDGNIIGFTIGERIGDSDTFDVHYEKADYNFEGSFQIINREFARYIKANHSDIKYINREEDMGLEGLRQSKESYHPDMMLIKYTAVLEKEIC